MQLLQKEVKEKYGISDATLRKKARKGELKETRKGNRVYYDEEDIAKLLKEQDLRAINTEWTEEKMREWERVTKDLKEKQALKIKKIKPTRQNKDPIYNLSLLANAIIKQAADDYREARKKVKNGTLVEINKKEIKDIERFFNSELYHSITNIGGKYMIDRLRKEKV